MCSKVKLLLLQTHKILNATYKQEQRNLSLKLKHEYSVHCSLELRERDAHAAPQLSFRKMYNL